MTHKKIFRIFLRAILYNICRKDIDYLRLYNNCIKENFGYNFNDGTVLANIFNDIVELSNAHPADRIDREILEIIRKFENLKI